MSADVVNRSKFFGLLLLLPSVVWVARDRHVWAWDPAIYGRTTLDLWWTLTHGSLVSWSSAMRGAIGFKAPGIAWWGQIFVPVGEWLGSIDIGLQLSVIANQALTLYFLFQIGTRISGGKPLAGWLAVTGAASAPLFAGMSRHYFAEPLQLLGVTWLYWAAIESPGWGRLRIVAHLLLGGSIAMLGKASSPLYAAGPVLVGIYSLIKGSNRRDASRAEVASTLVLLASGIVLSAMTSVWYLQNLRQLGDFILTTSSGQVALNYGHKGDVLKKLSFWFSESRAALFTPAVGFTVCALALIAVGLSLWQGRLRAFRMPSLISLVAAGHLIAVLGIFALQINEETRYLLPALPAWIIVFVCCVTRPPTRAFVVVSIAAFLIQYRITEFRAFGNTSISVSKLNPWLTPLTVEDRQDEELKRLVSLTSTAADESHSVINGLELPWISGNTLYYYGTKHRQEHGTTAAYWSLGYAQSDIDAAWNRLLAPDVSYLVSLIPKRHPNPPDFLNKTAQPILERVAAAKEFERVAFESSEGIVIFRKVTVP